MGLERGGQRGNKGFNAHQNQEKALFGLLGLLTGLTVDSRLSEQELLFLHTWLRSQVHLAADGEVVDMLDFVGDILDDGTVVKIELEEMCALLRDVLHYRDDTLTGLSAQINKLHGILNGITADQRVTAQELEFLSEWLEENAEVQKTWIGAEIVRHIKRVLADGVVTPEESEHLLVVCRELAGNQFEETGLAVGLSLDFFCDEPAEYVNEGRCICFTGKFVCGPRRAVESAALEQGATISNRVSGNINTLVIGTLVSKDWRFRSYGRKIEEALRLREEGREILILSEEYWFNQTMPMSK